MKKILLLIFLVISNYCFTQDVIMQNGTVTTCSGTFYDSGGESSHYSNNENYTLTICPEEAGQRVTLDFDYYSTQSSDVMTIYDGSDTSAPVIGEYISNIPTFVFASFENPSGCLTIKFISDDNLGVTGWAATISCAMPCQDITAQLDSTFPLANAEGIIEVCTNENINLSGSGIFEEDGTGATYTWDLGDGNTASGQVVDISYDMPGVYLVNLDIRDTNTDNMIQGCPNSNLINLIIRVSGEPDFTGTQATNEVLCFGETTTLEGVVNPLTLVYNCPPPETEVTFLPDGNGIAYSTSIIVTCFNDTQTLTDISQIESICLNMEHSYLGDLDIDIISPSGQIVRLHDQGGGSANLGIPWATNTVDGQSLNVTHGTGFDYCFVPNGGFPTIVEGIQTGGTFPAGDGPETYTDNFVPEGNYSAIDSIDGLIGSPLNGNWTIRIVDNLGADNGYIFSWELNFDPILQLEDYDFVPTIVSQSWDSDPSITEVNGNTVTVTPETAGEFCYTFRTIDEFGCEHSKEVCIDVAEQDATTITYFEDIDGDGYGDPNSSITIDCSGSRPEGYVSNNSDCDDTDSSINPGANDENGNGIDENCDGVDGTVLGIDEVDFSTIKVFPNPFHNSVTINLPTILDGRDLNINIYDMRGRIVYHNSLSSSSGLMTINTLGDLKKATYFIEISNKEKGLKVIKKLMKI